MTYPMYNEKGENVMEKLGILETNTSASELDKDFLAKGVKYDDNKPEYSLLPPVALLEMTKNLTFGAQKYCRENWRRVPDAKRRYFDAAFRHMQLWHMGETDDPENNLHHLAAAAVNLMFILELDLLDIRDEYQQFKQHLERHLQPRNQP